MVTIRPFAQTDADYEALAVLEMAVWPEYPDTVEEWKHRDQTREPQFLFQRFVGEIDGKAVAIAAYLEPWWSAKPGKYYLSIDVHPDFRRQGIGAAFYEHFMSSLAELGPVLLTANTREDQADAVRFLTRRGFKQVMRYPVSRLNVPGFAPAEFAGTLDRVESLGITILSLSEVALADPDWKRKLWELEWELLQDIPSPEPLTRQSFENFVARTLGAPGFNPDGAFIALDGEQWVGMSALWSVPADPEKLYTGLTGVARTHRRKRIATAMKVRAIEFAQRQGIKIIETDNEENNPMYLLNLKLGFEPQPAWLDFEKRIKEE